MNSKAQITETYSKLWEQCLHIIKGNVSEQQYKTWFEPIVCLSYINKVLTVQVPSHFVYEHLEEHFVGLLYSTLTRVCGTGTSLMYRVEADKTHNITVDYEATNRPTSTSNSRKNNTLANKAPHPLQATTPQELDSQLNPNYSFDNFIEGSSNKLPCSVGKAIADKPAQTAFNPLFIYGASGVGKTHLVNAIGSKIKEKYPTKRVLYLSAHLFQVQYTDSVVRNTVNDFINFYQTIDVLIIDDIQEFAGLTKTQNTFFHIFNHLHQNGKQLILTSDRPPVALRGLEERLLTRFKWGLLAELELPNVELRREILQSKINHDGLQFPIEVINYIAENVHDSVRDLEGVVNSLMAYSVVYNRNVDITLAEKVVKRAVKIENKPITVEQILDKTCEHFKVSIDEVFTSSRKRTIVQVRQVAMYLAQKYTELSSARIGTLIGKRNHATVLHSCNLVEGRIQVDKNFKAEVSIIEANLRKKTQ